MGFILLALAIICEITLFIFTLKTRKRNRKLRGIVHIIFSAVFLILCLCNVIQWGFRYYVFGILLGIQCVAGIISLFRSKEEKEKNPAGQILGMIFSCIGYFAALSLAIVFPQFKSIPVSGDYKVATTHVCFEDSSRTETYDQNGKHRQVSAMVWYPKDDISDCPLVIFSHGFYGISLSNHSLFQELASNGYVVVSVEHPYQSFYTSGQNGKITTISPEYLKEYQIANATEDCSVSFPYFQKWMLTREADMDFILDTILKKAKDAKSNIWYHKIDTKKIIASGHSLGGSAALGLGRHRDDITAVVALESPYMSDIIGVDKSKNEFIWEDKTYPVPVLNIYSDCTWNQFDKSQVYTENQLALDGQNGQVRNVHIADTGHLELCDLSILSPILTKSLDPSYNGSNSRKALEEINQEVLPFINYYAKNEGDRPDMH